MVQMLYPFEISLFCLEIELCHAYQHLKTTLKVLVETSFQLEIKLELPDLIYHMYI